MPSERLLDLANLLRKTADMHRMHSIALGTYVDDGGNLAIGAQKLAAHLDVIAVKIEEGKYD